jgi:hypothetical protein
LARFQARMAINLIVTVPVPTFGDQANFCPKHAARKERYRAATVKGVGAFGAPQ